MKTLFYSALICLLIVLSAGSYSSNSISGSNQVNAIQFAYNKGLQGLAQQWSDHFQRINPGIQVIPVEKGNEKLSEGSVIYLSPKRSLEPEVSENYVIGKEVTLLVINKNNPLLSVILRKGVKLPNLAAAFSTIAGPNWGQLLEIPSRTNINLYISDNPVVLLGLRNLSGSVAAFRKISGGELLKLVSQDTEGLGICALSEIPDWNDVFVSKNISILPIDKNQNGLLDASENIYAGKDEFLRGVWIGKYPHALCSSLYMITEAGSRETSVNRFISWALADGQQYLGNSGLAELTSTERMAQFEKVNPPMVEVPTGKSMPMFYVLLIVVASILLLGFLITWIAGMFRTGVDSIKNPAGEAPAFDDNSFETPKGILFDKTHTWAFMERDGFVTVGLDDFLRHVIGSITKADMKPEGSFIKKGDELIAISHSGKKLLIYSPVSGTIRRINKKMQNEPEKAFKTSYAEGWVYQIEPSDWNHDTRQLQSAVNYQSWIRTEFLRFRDFLTVLLSPAQPQFQHVVLQDGGTVKEGVLTDLSPGVWEDFQVKFLDAVK